MAIVGISGKISAGKDEVAKIIQYLTSGLEKTDVTYNEFNKRLSKLPNDYKSSWEIHKFAGKLKQIVSLLTGIPVEDLEKQEVKDSYLGEEWDYKLDWDSDKREQFISAIQEGDRKALFPNRVRRYKVRDLLQKLGTEALRNVIHENVHINALFTDYKHNNNYVERGHEGSGDFTAFYKYPNWIISDLRFPNEYQAIKDKDGICIRINREIKLNNRSIGKTETISKEIVKQNIHPSETALDNYEFDYVINNNGTIEDLIRQIKEILIKEKLI